MADVVDVADSAFILSCPRGCARPLGLTGTRMRFGYAILHVDDVASTLDFYGKAFGLTTPMR